MSDLRKAAEELIKEWDWECGEHQNKALTDLIEALRQALAQPEQRGHCTCGDPTILGYVHFRTRPCIYYTAPLKREWVGLAKDEIHEMIMGMRTKNMGVIMTEEIFRDVEAKLKEKNS